MSIAGRLKRLETAMACPRESKRPKTFDQLLADLFALEDCIAERGFADAWATVEAGETGPPGMEQALVDAAATAYRERIFHAIEKELDANRLPSEELPVTRTYATLLSLQRTG